MRGRFKTLREDIGNRGDAASGEIDPPVPGSGESNPVGFRDAGSSASASEALSLSPPPPLPPRSSDAGGEFFEDVKVCLGFGRCCLGGPLALMILVGLSEKLAPFFGFGLAGESCVSDHNTFGGEFGAR